MEEGRGFREKKKVERYDDDQEENTKKLKKQQQQLKKKKEENDVIQMVEDTTTPPSDRNLEITEQIRYAELYFDSFISSTYSKQKGAFCSMNQAAIQMKRKMDNGEDLGFSVDQLQEICYFTHENSVPSECKIVCYIAMYTRAISFLQTSGYLHQNEFLFDSVTHGGIRRKDLYDRILSMLKTHPDPNKIDILRWCHDGFICIDLYNAMTENYRNRKRYLFDETLFSFDEDSNTTTMTYSILESSSSSSSSSSSTITTTIITEPDEFNPLPTFDISNNN